MKVRKLKKGDKVAIVSLSSGLLGEDFNSHCLDKGLKNIAEIGLEVVMMPHALKGLDYIAKHPDKRAEDLKAAILDPSIKAIICAIGGHCTYLTLPYLMDNQEFINAVKTSDKIFLGFSDSTVNHLMFYKLGLNTLYGQAFITEFCELGKQMLEYSKQAFLSLFEDGPQLEFTSSPVWYEERSDFSKSQIDVERISHPETRGYEVLKGNGKVSGKLLGGCVESLSDYFMSDDDEIAILDKYQIFPSVEEWQGKILFLETAELECNTTPEVLEKILNHFKEFGLFEAISGIIVGKPQNEKYYEEFKQVYLKVLASYDFPIMYNLNFGHALPRGIIPYNIKVELDLDNKKIALLEEVFI